MKIDERASTTYQVSLTGDEEPFQSLRPERSIILQLLTEPPSQKERKQLLIAETRWHYSTHYLAEKQGEEVLENILQWVHGSKGRSLLEDQLKDELQHVRLFQGIVDRIGVDERASHYARKYSSLVKSQRTLSEKVFVFQILTEAVSSGYCAWRLNSFSDPDFRAVDTQVMQDEVRHLQMGKSLLALCDQDEVRSTLTLERRKELIKTMNSVCKEGFKDQMPEALAPGLPVHAKTTILDKVIAYAVLRENAGLPSSVEGLR